jgi:hypothetical protein
VSVRNGGQAIVGHVTQNVPVALPNKIARAPLAIEDRKSAPMPPVGEQEPDPLISRAVRRNGNG